MQQPQPNRRSSFTGMGTRLAPCVLLDDDDTPAVAVAGTAVAPLVLADDDHAPDAVVAAVPAAAAAMAVAVAAAAPSPAGALDLGSPNKRKQRPSSHDTPKSSRRDFRSTLDKSEDDSDDMVQDPGDAMNEDSDDPPIHPSQPRPTQHSSLTPGLMAASLRSPAQEGAGVGAWGGNGLGAEQQGGNVGRGRGASAGAGVASELQAQAQSHSHAQVQQVAGEKLAPRQLDFGSKDAPSP